MRLRKQAVMACLAALLCSAPTASAAGGLELRGIMRELASDMGEIVKAISLEDYETVKKRAMRVAEHERPPVEERMRIMKFLEADAAGFKAADGVVHDSAKRLAEAAEEGDLFEVSNAFMDVLTGCADCHAKYRGPIIRKFYTN